MDGQNTECSNFVDIYDIPQAQGISCQGKQIVEQIEAYPYSFL